MSEEVLEVLSVPTDNAGRQWALKGSRIYRVTKEGADRWPHQCVRGTGEALEIVLIDASCPLVTHLTLWQKFKLWYQDGLFNFGKRLFA